MMLRSLFEREERAIQSTPWGPWSGSGARSHAGVAVDTTSALNLLTVYGATALISDTIATLPVDVLRKRGSGIPGTRPAWLEDPTELQTQILTSLLLDGNAYLTWTLERGVPANVTAIDPGRMRPRVIDEQAVYFLNGRPFEGRLMHIKSVMRAGSITGLSPVEAARQSIGLGLAAQQFGAQLFRDGANMSGVIETPKQLSPEAAQILAMKWGRDHSGLDKAHQPGVLTEGAAWKPVSVTPEQAQFLETRGFTAAEISGQMFLLDPTLLGIPVEGKSLTYANLQDRGIHLVQFTLLRWIVRVERAFTLLLPSSDDEVKHNVEGLQRADLKTRFESYKIGIESGVLQRNEAREKEDRPPLDEQVRVSLDDSEVIGRLIRSGFTAESVIEAVQTGDLSVLEHTGALPTTVQSDDAPTVEE